MLLNPAKNQIGRVSKHILQNINKILSEEIKVNEWENTESVINWLKSIPNKYLYLFLMFDIKDFCPSVKEKLLWEAIRFPNFTFLQLTRMKKQYSMQGNPFYTTNKNRGSKKEKATLMFLWAHKIGQRYVN